MLNKMQVCGPFDDLVSAQGELDCLCSELGCGEGALGSQQIEWSPRVDISEDDESLRITAELSGMSQKDVKIVVKDGVLTMSGERAYKDEEKKKNYCRVERYYGSFVRSFTLPLHADVEKIQASMKDGLLELVVPMKEEAKQKEIEVKAA